MSSLLPPDGDQAALEFLQHPNFRPISCFVLGSLFITSLRYFALSLFRSYKSRAKLHQRPITIVRLDDVAVSDAYDATVQEKPAAAAVSSTNPDRSALFANSVVTVLTLCYAMASLCQFISLLTFRTTGDTITCAFFVASGGLSAQAGGILGLYRLSLDLQSLRVRRWERWIFLLLVGVGSVTMCVEEGFSSGTTHIIAGLPFALCYRKHFVLLSAVNSAINILCSIYASARLFAFLAPEDLTWSSAFATVCDIRVARAVSLLLLNTITFIPAMTGPNIASDVIPFALGALIVVGMVASAPLIPSANTDIEFLLALFNNTSSAPSPPLVLPTTSYVQPRPDEQTELPSRSSSPARGHRRPDSIAHPRTALTRNPSGSSQAQYLEMRPPTGVTSQASRPTSRSLTPGQGAMAPYPQTPTPPRNSWRSAVRAHAPLSQVSETGSAEGDDNSRITLNIRGPFTLGTGSGRSSPRRLSRRGPDPPSPSALESLLAAAPHDSPTPPVSPPTAQETFPRQPSPGSRQGSPSLSSEVKVSDTQPQSTRRRIVSHLSALVPPTPPSSSTRFPRGIVPPPPRSAPRIHIPSTPAPERSPSTGAVVQSSRPLSWLANSHPNAVPPTPNSFVTKRSTSDNGTPSQAHGLPSSTESNGSVEFARSPSPYSNADYDDHSTTGTSLRHSGTSRTTQSTWTTSTRRTPSTKSTAKDPTPNQHDKSIARRTFGSASVRTTARRASRQSTRSTGRGSPPEMMQGLPATPHPRRHNSTTSVRPSPLSPTPSPLPPIPPLPPLIGSEWPSWALAAQPNKQGS
ncbi:hypothetical protein FRB99_005537 [Tulasnella sp. 403]|nr:hypothetical protein FRB99_005537 [Tulasnella sp. 403]